MNSAWRAIKDVINTLAKVAGRSVARRVIGRQIALPIGYFGVDERFGKRKDLLPL